MPDDPRALMYLGAIHRLSEKELAPCAYAQGLRIERRWARQSRMSMVNHYNNTIKRYGWLA